MLYQGFETKLISNQFTGPDLRPTISRFFLVLLPFFWSTIILHNLSSIESIAPNFSGKQMVRQQKKVHTPLF